MCGVTKLDRIRKERIRGTKKVGGISKSRKGGKVAWACDEKRRALRRKESDGNGSTRTKEESPKRRYQREVNVREKGTSDLHGGVYHHTSTP